MKTPRTSFLRGLAPTRPLTPKGQGQKSSPVPETGDAVQWSGQTAEAPAPIPQALQTRPLQLDPQATPGEIVRTVSEHLLTQPCLSEGMNEAYSPNHMEGMTTRVHVEAQLRMVNHYVGRETAALSAFQSGDYEALHQMVDNPNVEPHLRVTKEDLENLFEPLRQGLTPSDWKVLTVVAGFHDLGKVNQNWAKQAGMELKGVEWIAHDYDSETLLRNNPSLLEPYQLDDEERKKVLSLCRLHSLPGQYFFGEGNVSAYSPLFRTAETDKSENVLKMARIHGALDVMSALNHKMVKGVLTSHLKLRDFISEAYARQTPLGMKYRQAAGQDFETACQGEDGPALLSIQRDFGLGQVAIQRLQRLLGPDVKPHHIQQALGNLPHEVAYEFQEATDREQTWFGTYVANSYGASLAKALKIGKPDALAKGHEVAEAMLKMIACSARFRRRMDQNQAVREEWALGSLGPSLAVASGPEGALAVLRETQRFHEVDQGLTQMTGPASRLTIRGGQTGVELGWR